MAPMQNDQMDRRWLYGADVSSRTRRSLTICYWIDFIFVLSEKSYLFSLNWTISNEKRLEDQNRLNLAYLLRFIFSDPPAFGVIFMTTKRLRERLFEDAKVGLKSRKYYTEIQIYKAVERKPIYWRFLWQKCYSKLAKKALIRFEFELFNLVKFQDNAGINCQQRWNAAMISGNQGLNENMMPSLMF